MPLTSNDVAAFAKREHAHRTRLAGFIALMLALALFILPTLESPITSITGNSRLLGPLDLCGREHDDCPTDHSKTKPGFCGCGVPDIDTDGDGTPDCKDRCPSDDKKTSPGACGCGITDTYTDTDGDGTLDCNDGCPRDASKTSSGICGCGVPNTDTDGDGTPDCKDGCPRDASKTSKGVCGCGIPDTDTDGDGTPDCNDGCPRDVSKISPGACGCGFTDTYTDTDGDGTLDCNDGCPRDARKTSPGACGCGFTDTYTDTDGDGTIDCKDSCPRHAGKTNYGVCGCGAPDTDTDGDGTPDCHDLCPHDASKTFPGVCGCGAPDTDTDGDGKLDCRDDCVDNDTSILSACASHVIYDCEGCAGKYYRAWKECGLMCSSDIDYCLDVSEEAWFVYDENLKYFRVQSYSARIIQTGADSGNSVLDFLEDCETGPCVVNWFINGVRCIDISTNPAPHIACDDGNEYYIEEGVPTLPSNPLFYRVNSVPQSMLHHCFYPNTATTSEFEMKPIDSELSQYASAFFNQGA